MIDRPPPEPEVQAALDRAQAHLDAGDLPAALGECDAALQTAPQWAEAHNLRGVVLDEMGRTAEAVAAYREALRLDAGLSDAAENLAELRRESGLRVPRWMRVAGALTPLVVLAVVLLIFRALEAERGPDWSLALNEYIAESRPGATVQKVATADHPASFVPEMGTLMPGGVQWEGVSPVFPPRAVQCVVLATGDGRREVATAPRVSREVVYVAYHSDGLHHLGWRVYEAREAPYEAELTADLDTIGCRFPAD